MRVRTIRSRAEEGEPIRGAEQSSTSPKSALTEKEAAQYIGMSAAWLKKSRTQRFRAVIEAPPFVRAGAKRIVYRLEDLDAWQERHLEQVGPVREFVTGGRNVNEEPNRMAGEAVDTDAHR
jgi:predicted DNA-binding transcriptional regulator AlpA